jgi:hypothetical protein
MTDPGKFDDDWAELARELERDKPSSPPPLNEQIPHSEQDAPLGDEGLFEERAEGDDSAPSDEFEDAGEPGTTGEGDSNDESASGDGQPGTGRKRRRRRRRRRKGTGTQPVDAGTNAEAENEQSDTEEAEVEEPKLKAQPAFRGQPVFKAQPAVDESDYTDESSDELEDDLANSPVNDIDEDAGGELLRELIANWNVPSWDDVVSGLYRPDR